MTRTAGSWRVRELASEALRRIAGLHTATGLALAAILGTCLLVSTADLKTAFAAEQAAREAGLDVSVVTVAQDSWLDAAQCEALSQAPGVLAAGASLGENITTTAVWTPSGIDLPLVDLTAGGLRTWWPEYDGSTGLFVGRDLSSTRGLSPGMRMSIDGQRVTVTDRLPPSVAPVALQSSVVRVVPASGRAQECWLRVPAGSAGAAEQTAMVGLAGSTVLVTAFLDPATRTGIVQRLSESAGRMAWLVATVAGLALLGFVGVTRRREVGVYRATGTGWPALTAMHSLQVLVLAWTAMLLVATTGMLWVALTQLGLPTSPDVLWYLLQPILLVTLAWIAVGPLVLRIAGAGAIVDILDD